MKELKNKKTGRISIINDEEYLNIIVGSSIANKFTVTDIRSRPIASVLKDTKPKIK